MEEWRAVAGEFLGWPYFVSNTGRVKGGRYNRFQKLSQVHNGYLRVTLRHEGQSKFTTVHRLVLSAFVRPPLSEADQCNHKDGNKKNNNVANLEWVDVQENHRHAAALGLIGTGQRRLSTEEAIHTISSKEPSSVLAKRFGVGIRAIQKIRSRRTYKDITEAA